MFNNLMPTLGLRRDVIIVSGEIGVPFHRMSTDADLSFYMNKLEAWHVQAAYHLT